MAALAVLFFLASGFSALAQDEGIVPMKNPPPHTLHLYCLSTGRFRANYAQMVAGGPWKPVEPPVPVYLIRHPAAWILFDAGFGTKTKEDFLSFPEKLIPFFLKFDWRPEDSVVSQLRQINLFPDDIRFILLSHLHSDHAGGIRDFPRATVFVSQSEWEAAQGGHWSNFRKGYIASQWESERRRIAPINDKVTPPYQNFEHAHDLFGDGSIILIPTPGHTAGHWSLLLNFPSGKSMLLTADAAWTTENYQKPARRGFFARYLTQHDEAKEWESLGQIRKFTENNLEVMVIPGHDPTLWPSLKKFPEYYE